MIINSLISLICVIQLKNKPISREEANGCHRNHIQHGNISHIQEVHSRSKSLLDTQVGEEVVGKVEDQEDT